jgi:RNA polymerase sigma-70 factor, ECF subfamily
MTALNSSIPGLDPAPPAEAARSGVRPGREEAAALYEAYADRVLRYVAFRVRDRDDADDLVSEVFRRVVSGPAPAEPEARPAWIFRVTHNVVVDHYRRRRIPLLPPEVLDRPDDAPSLPDQFVADERMRATDEAIRQLPGRQRAAIYFRFHEDLPYDTIAVVMGVPAVTVRSLVHRGLRRVAATLGEENDR